MSSDRYHEGHAPQPPTPREHTAAERHAYLREQLTKADPNKPMAMRINTAASDPTMCKIPLDLVKRMRDEFQNLASYGTQQVIDAATRKSALAPELDKAAKDLQHIANLMTAAIQEATRLENPHVPLPDLPTPKAGEVWRHFKDSADEVFIDAIVKHHGTKQPWVVYTHLGEDWVRPLAEWHDAEPKMGGRRRFEKGGQVP